MISPDDVEVDVLFGDDPWLRDALARPGKDPGGFPVLGMPNLVLNEADSPTRSGLG
jgi:hypothetical protein